ncbi:hypothetical protein F8A87_08285 [Betaproteobacteria bacterium SCN2]|jgi:flagellin-like hook-associated protein FlgL|nr:hypothetical protein F8A87_08285 [Betaproteobacteria bacterium SCN2]
MAIELEDNQTSAARQIKPDAAEQEPGLRLDLVIDDPEAIAALVAYPEGRERNRFVRTALRIGILALNQAQGRIDAESVRNEGDRLVREMEARLADYRRQTETLLTGTLKEYFDPQNGRFNERVERLVRQDGELEKLMRTQIEQNERALADTLTRHVGEDSVLMQNLSPDESNRFLAALRGHVETTLSTQADAILREFSLDNAEGALARLVRELKDKHGEAADDLKEKIGEVVQEFSLDNEQSALSRLVRRVESAQKQISDEFTLDSENSALARLKRELTQMIEAQNKAAQEFQIQVVGALDAMRAKKTAEAASTTHGQDFQQAGFEILQDLATRAGDIAEDTGSTTGLIPRSKVGDAVITLGADNAAAGARIAVEFKEDASYTLKSTLEEIDTARKNRDAGVGLFVHSRRTAPAVLETLARYGNDIIVVWDAEDESSDAYLKAAFMAAKAMAVRARVENAERVADFQAIDKSLTEIQRQAKYLDEIRTWSGTIKNNAEKVIDRVERMQKALDAELDNLGQQVEQLKSAS